MNVLGLDIGGANLKAALTNGTARSRSFALWKNPERLAEELRKLLRDWAFDRIAVTMTGELCDCFATKREGVIHILAAVRQLGSEIVVWRNDGQFESIDVALRDPLPVAAANWLALATFAGRVVPRGRAMLVDVGSTTTDVIPIEDGRPVPKGHNDTERLATGELIYTGVRRTPICAILGFEGMAEFFATTHDAYLTLGDIVEDANHCDTADGRSATCEFAHARLARMIGGDGEMPIETTQNLATKIRHAQCAKIAAQVKKHLPIETAIVSGSGEFLAIRALDRVVPRIVRLREQLGSEVSSAACAFAVAILADEGNHGP